MATTAGLRKIGKINLPNLEPNEIFGDTPRCILVNPSDLYVEEQYQRNLAENSVRLIRRLVRDWNWAHMKPPVAITCAPCLLALIWSHEHAQSDPPRHPRRGPDRFLDRVNDTIARIRANPYQYRVRFADARRAPVHTFSTPPGS